MEDGLDDGHVDNPCCHSLPYHSHHGTDGREWHTYPHTCSPRHGVCGQDLLNERAARPGQADHKDGGFVLKA